MFNEANYQDLKCQPIIVHGVEYSSIGKACESYYEPERGETLEVFYNCVRTKLKRKKHISSTEIDDIFSNSYAKALGCNTFAKRCIEAGLGITATSKTFHLLKKRIDGLTYDKFFNLTQKQIKELFAEK